VGIDLAALAAMPVVLIEAPAGFGKTRLAERLLAARGGRAVRVRADGPELADLAAAFGRGLRRAGLAADGTDPDPSAALDRSLGRLAGLASDGPMHLLVDDVHRLAPATAAVLADLLADRPADVDVVIAGRAWPGDRLDARLAGADDLRLDAADVAEFDGPVPRPAGARGVGRSVYFRDPDGNLLELLKRVRD